MILISPKLSVFDKSVFLQMEPKINEVTVCLVFPQVDCCKIGYGCQVHENKGFLFKLAI